MALNSGTAALHLALEALQVGPGDEVIVPTWTFAATAEVVRHLGATPVLVDVDARTLNVTPETIDAAITERTRAVIVVHFAGLPVDVSESSLPVIEDAAHAFPGKLRGLASAFSFYATKTLTTGEGGMLVTDFAEIAARARVMSLHGISKDAWNRYGEGGSWEYDVTEAGWKYNMTDLAAALGLAQLRRSGGFARGPCLPLGSL